MISNQQLDFGDIIICKLLPNQPVPCLKISRESCQIFWDELFPPLFSLLHGSWFKKWAFTKLNLLHVQVLLPFPLFWICSPRLIFFLVNQQITSTNEVTRALSFKPIATSHVIWQTEQKSLVFKNTTNSIHFCYIKNNGFHDISSIFFWEISLRN